MSARVRPRRRVVVTGMGIRSAIGSTISEVVENLGAGRSGVGPIRGFHADDLAVRFGAEIDSVGLAEHFTPRELRKLDRATQFALLAAGEALEGAGLDQSGVLPERLGIAIGVSGAGQFENAMVVPASRAMIHNRLAALFFARNVPHFMTEVVAARFGIRGFHVSFAAASAGSAVAIGQAVVRLRAGKADAVLVGGAEILPVVNVIGMQTLGVCAEVPASPFSGEPGISFGEGAAFLVLEELEHAQARGARILAEIFGTAAASDAYDVIANDPSGDGLYRAMRAALADARVEPSEIDWIRASGTGNRDQDLAETLAIKRLFASSSAPPTSSLDSFFGHVNGVAPALGLAAAVGAGNAGFIPPTVNFTEPRPGCDLDFVRNEARPARIRRFLSNSAAFGGVNAALVGGEMEQSGAPPETGLDAVAITGIGIVSPVGHGVEAFLEALRAGRSGVGDLDRFDTDGRSCRRAGLVRDFHPRRLAPTADLRRVDRIGQFSIVAASLALHDAGLAGGAAIPPERMGLVVGMAHGPVASHEEFFRTLFSGPPTPALGKLMLEMGRFAVTSRLAQIHRLKGFSTTLAGGITSGLHALVHACEYLRQSPNEDAILVVAADEIGALYHQLFDRLGVLSANGFAPYRSCAAGMVLGEGAVALLIERTASVRARGGIEYARLAGVGLAADGVGFLRSDPEARGLRRAAALALGEARVPPDLVDVVYGHGRGLAEYDAREARALAAVLEGRPVPACCVMGTTGVAEASSGLFGVAAAGLGIRHGEAYPLAEEDRSTEEKCPLMGARARTVELAGEDPSPDGGLRLRQHEAQPLAGEDPAAGNYPLAGDRALAGALAWVTGSTRRGKYRHALVAGGTESGNHAAVVLSRAEG